MRQLLISLLSIGVLGFLMGCSSSCYQGGCGYYDYNSQCGEYSCTNNDDISDFSNPCPGPYQCDVDP
jgi:hypothetical protein